MQGDFQSRVDEIEAYFNFIGSVDTGAILLLTSDNATSAYSTIEQANLLRTFRASAFLLLYNLMESTVTNAIQAIFDELEIQGVSFDDCSEQVRIVILGNLKDHKTKEIAASFNSIATDIVRKTFRREDVVSGNVDARKIRDLAADYGFEHPRVPLVRHQATLRGYVSLLPAGETLAGDGSKLLDVKNRRNKLAHGSSSFGEIGRDYTHSDMVRIKCEVVAYLDAMIFNVSDYIASQRYRN